MPYPTKIYNSKNQEVHPQINIQSHRDSNSWYTTFQIQIFIKDKLVGRLIAFTDLESHHLFIENTNNFSSPFREDHPEEKTQCYSHIARLLVDIIFDLSIKQGFGGKLKLFAAQASPASHFKNGFRYSSSAYNELEKAIVTYLIYPNLQRKQAIEQSEHYSKLQEFAAAQLKHLFPDRNIQAQELSFEEVIEHGQNDIQKNELLKNLISQHPVITEEMCKEYDLHQYMYFPKENIQKKQLAFTKATQSYNYVLQRLQSLTLDISSEKNHMSATMADMSPPTQFFASQTPQISANEDWENDLQNFIYKEFLK
jgi:hypothetical protein